MARFKLKRKSFGIAGAIGGASEMVYETSAGKVLKVGHWCSLGAGSLGAGVLIKQVVEI